jgi:hypothetical protein
MLILDAWQLQRGKRRNIGGLMIELAALAMLGVFAFCATLSVLSVLD